MPPTMTGLPSNEGFTKRSTDTKNVSKSKCKIVLSIKKPPFFAQNACIFQKSCTFDEFLIKIFAIKLIIIFETAYKKAEKIFKS